MPQQYRRHDKKVILGLLATPTFCLNFSGSCLWLFLSFNKWE